jgi:hypothetical protein
VFYRKVMLNIIRGIKIRYEESRRIGTQSDHFSWKELIVCDGRAAHKSCHFQSFWTIEFVYIWDWDSKTYKINTKPPHLLYSPFILYISYIYSAAHFHENMNTFADNESIKILLKFFVTSILTELFEYSLDLS